MDDDRIDLLMSMQKWSVYVALRPEAIKKGLTIEWEGADKRETRPSPMRQWVSL